MTALNPVATDPRALTQQFLATLRQDPTVAVSRWQEDVTALHPQLAATAARLAANGLDWATRSSLNSVDAGRRLLWQWDQDRIRKPSLPDIPFLSQESAFAFCSSLMEQRGVPAVARALRQGRVALLGLRRDTSTLANRGQGVFDDYIVVLNGWRRRGSVTFFPATTEPGAQYAERARPVKGKLADDRYEGVIPASKAHGADVDKDGILDAGRLLAGTYFFKNLGRDFLGAPAFQSVGRQTVERDTNGDGRFDWRDLERIDRVGVGRTMYIHRGGQNNTGSAGCQTVRKDHYPSFLNSIGNTPFYYVLVDCV